MGSRCPKKCPCSDHLLDLLGVAQFRGCELIYSRISQTNRELSPVSAHQTHGILSFLAEAQDPAITSAQVLRTVRGLAPGHRRERVMQAGMKLLRSVEACSLRNINVAQAVPPRCMNLYAGMHLPVACRQNKTSTSRHPLCSLWQTLNSCADLSCL